jgi:sulfur-carrier protein adenylyltransferase/sulfurtransferase
MRPAHRIIPAAAPENPLSPAELAQYSRQLILPEIGLEGQRKLRDARVLVVGAGGLGSPALLYLAAAGVGTLGIVEYDRVDQSNLHRQLLFDSGQVGLPKLTAAQQRLSALNPHTRIEPHAVRLSVDNALEVIGRYDYVIDATDNFPTRYLINDACVLTGTPNISASIFRFEGQLSLFWPQRGPCYRCLFPEPPPPDLVPSCAEGGVLGVLPGIIGSLQAAEAIKAILDVGTLLIGRLLTFDALTMRFREMTIARAPDCPICSARARNRGLTAYTELCSATAQQAAEPLGADIEEISATDLRERLNARQRLLLLDVRSPTEHAISNIEGALLIPLDQLEARCAELPRDVSIVCYCQSGKRSRRAAALLAQSGFTAPLSLRGGIESFSRL